MTTIKVNEKVNKGARLSIKRHREPIGKHNKYIKLNPTIISSNYTDLHSNYIASILDTNYILSTI